MSRRDFELYTPNSDAANYHNRQYAAAATGCGSWRNLKSKFRVFLGREGVCETKNES